MNLLPRPDSEYWYKKSRDDITERYVYLWLAFEAKLFETYKCDDTRQLFQFFLADYGDFLGQLHGKLDIKSMDKLLVNKIKSDPSVFFDSENAVKKIREANGLLQFQLEVCYQVRNEIVHRSLTPRVIHLTFKWLESIYYPLTIARSLSKGM